MKNFFTVAFILFKNRVLSRAYLAIMSVFLGLICAWSLLCPAPAPSSADIGLIIDEQNSVLFEYFSPLLGYDEITFIHYPPENEQQLIYDVITKKLHCGYKITESETPITVFETNGSFLTPVLDEMIFAAWFEYDMTENAAKLYSSGRHDALIKAEISRQKLSAKPMKADIVLNTHSAIIQDDAPSLTPALYSAEISLAILFSAFCAILAPKQEADAIFLLCQNKNRIKIFSAEFLANTVAFMVPLLLCECLLAAFSIKTGFFLTVKLITATITAVLCAVCFLLCKRAAQNTMAIFWLIIWTAVSVIFSGAFISPEIFGSFEALKYISPPWHLLKLMTDLTL